MKVVIVGGVAGGASAAARLRRLDENIEIVVFERSGFMSYANCGLPYYIGGVIEDKHQLTIQTPVSFRARYTTNVYVKAEVTSIDRENKTVHVIDSKRKKEFDEPYDVLLLAPGARAFVPDVPGIDDDRIFTLRTVEDTYSIYDFIAEKQPKTATVVGGGFIGLEMAENLTNRGIKVTLVQRRDHVMPQFDTDMGTILGNRLLEKGVDLRVNSPLTGFAKGADGSLITQVDGGEDISSDFAILAIGVRPETTLAKDAGLELGIRDSIVVDEHLRTSDPSIYAVGDAIQVRQLVNGQPTLIPLAGPANKQARIVADNICGIDSTYKGTLGSSVVKVFDLTAASTGLNLAQAKAAGYDCDYIVITPPSHATYYPNAHNMTMKVVFENGTGRILGAQIVGVEGVDKRIDVLGTAIRYGATGSDLAEYELAYAPPYSSAKDPVNMAGFVIEDIVTGKVKIAHWEEMETLPENEVILDVRSPSEYDQTHLVAAKHIPVDVLRKRLGELDPEKPLFVHCQTGLRSYVACRILEQHGFKCRNVTGGYGFYLATLPQGSAEPTQVGACGLRAGDLED